jgi:cephalosporin hydroxylase
VGFGLSSITMKLSLDTDSKTLSLETAGETRQLSLYTPEAFSALSSVWLQVGWSVRYTYGFSWMGRPMIQLPEDMIRIQEVIYRVRPDVLIETGVAHGGSLVFYAGLFKAMGRGRVIGVDIDIRAHNRQALEEHELAPLITLVEGSSIDPGTVSAVKSLVGANEKVLVVLDSDHSYAHVSAELRAYAALVGSGSYIVATDGIIQSLADVPGGKPHWRQDNPSEAAAAFAREHPEFVREDPPFSFNEGTVTDRVTQWPGAYLRRR